MKKKKAKKPTSPGYGSAYFAAVNHEALRKFRRKLPQGEQPQTFEQLLALLAKSMK